jgi:hypothetical protein
VVGGGGGREEKGEEWERRRDGGGMDKDEEGINVRRGERKGERPRRPGGAVAPARLIFFCPSQLFIPTGTKKELGSNSVR